VIASCHFLFRSVVEFNLSRQDLWEKTITLFLPRCARMKVSSKAAWSGDRPDSEAHPTRLKALTLHHSTTMSSLSIFQVLAYELYRTQQNWPNLCQLFASKTPALVSLAESSSMSMLLISPAMSATRPIQWFLAASSFSFSRLFNVFLKY
jgi:hypothetical protein